MNQSSTLKCQHSREAFNRDMCVSAWEKMGAVTKDGITQQCLKDSRAMHSIGDGNNKVDELHNLIQTSNNLAAHTLMQAGYDGKLLRATMKKGPSRKNHH